MQLYSTNNKNHIVSLEEAVFKGLPQDNGLYMPTYIPNLPTSFFENIEKYSMQEIAFEVTKTLLKDAIPEAAIKKIVDEAITFEAPAVLVHDSIYSLELFHGPTLAFKDFGARFMSKLMGYYLDKQANNINI